MAILIPLLLSEEVEEQENTLAQQQIFRDRTDPFEFHDDLEFIQRFRFSRSAILNMTELMIH